MKKIEKNYKVFEHIQKTSDLFTYLLKMPPSTTLNTAIVDTKDEFRFDMEEFEEDFFNFSSNYDEFTDPDDLWEAYMNTTIKCVPLTNPSLDMSDKEIVNCINNIFSSTHSICNYPLQNEYGFFNMVVDSESENDFAKLFHEKRFWEKLLKQHVIFDAYDKIRKLSSFKIEPSVYKFTKLIHPFNQKDTTFEFKDSVHYYGLYYLIRNGYNSKDQKISTLNDIQYYDQLGKKTNPYPKKTMEKYRSNHNRQISELYRNISSHCNVSCFNTFSDDILLNTVEKVELEKVKHSHHKEDLKKELIKKNQYRKLVHPNLFEFTQLTLGRKEISKKNRIKNILQSREPGIVFDRNMYRKMFNDYESILSNLNFEHLFLRSKSESNFHFEFADKIYARYILERTFSMKSIDYLYHTITNDSYKNVLKMNLSTLSYFSLLPNPFGRDVILQAGIDELKQSMLFNRGPFNREGKLFYRIENSEAKDIPWSKRFLNLIHKYQRHIFPLYETHFFISLWNLTREKCESDQECLDVLFIVLSRYLNQPSAVSDLLSFDDLLNELGLIYDEEIDFYCDDKKIDVDFYKECIDAYTLRSKAFNNTPFLYDEKYIEKLYPSYYTDLHNKLFEKAISPDDMSY